MAMSSMTTTSTSSSSTKPRVTTPPSSQQTPQLVVVVTLLVVLVGVAPLTNAESLKFQSQMEKTLRGRPTPHHLDPEVFMTPTELITSKGFPCESHWVTTEDGYILRLYRIPHGRHRSNSKERKPVVFLQHGLLGSATNFLTNPVNESLSFILADAGADVWLGNSRGNIYSMNHTTLKSHQRQFWQFTWDDMAKYDLPASIDYVLKTTQERQLYYVGHSQGTTIAFARLSEDPELNSKIKHFIALAPVTRAWHSKTPLRKLAPYSDTIAHFMNMFGEGDFWTSQEFTHWLAGHLCNTWGAACADILFVACGFDYKSFNMTRMPVLLAHNPAGTSVMNILKWAQAINSHHFQKFDWGTEEENMEHYNQPTPPTYDLSNVKVPVSVFAGGKDWLAVPEDVEWLLPQVNVTHFHDVTHYAHLDFIWAFDAPHNIYSKFMPLIFQK